MDYGLRTTYWVENADLALRTEYKTRTRVYNILLSECRFPLSLLLFRLNLNPFFGVLLDKNGAKKKKWPWHNLKEHVHAPPFQPITFMITKQLSIRCLSQVSSDFKCFLSYVVPFCETLLRCHSKQYNTSV